MNQSSLPIDIIKIIINYLDVVSVGRLAGSSKFFRELCPRISDCDKSALKELFFGLYILSSEDLLYDRKNCTFVIRFKQKKQSIFGVLKFGYNSEMDFSLTYHIDTVTVMGNGSSNNHYLLKIKKYLEDKFDVDSPEDHLNFKPNGMKDIYNLLLFILIKIGNLLIENKIQTQGPKFTYDDLSSLPSTVAKCIEYSEIKGHNIIKGGNSAHVDTELAKDIFNDLKVNYKYVLNSDQKTLSKFIAHVIKNTS